MKICVAMPSSNGYIRTETHLSILNVIYNTPGVDLYHTIRTGCYVHENRWYLVHEAKDNKSDYLFFVDTDMSFPPDTLGKLLAHKKPVVGASYNMRHLPLETTVKFADKKGNLIAKKAEEIPMTPFQCFALGTGCMLIDMKVFDQIPSPWFSFDYEKNGKMRTGEDIFFCRLCWKAGIEVWCDPTIDVAHVGTYNY